MRPWWENDQLDELPVGERGTVVPPSDPISLSEAPPEDSPQAAGQTSEDDADESEALEE